MTDNLPDWAPLLPRNTDAENALLASLIINPTRMDEVGQIVEASDFYGKRNQAVYRVLQRLHAQGRLRSEDHITVRDELRAEAGFTNVDLADVLEWVVWTPEHARIVVQYATARRTMLAGIEIVNDALTCKMAPDELVDAAKAAVEAVKAPAAYEDVWDRLTTFEDFLERVDHQPKPWVIPGIIRKGWRIVIVAGEGSGKTVLMRSLAAGAAAGVNPLKGSEAPPQTALVFDLENPDDAIAETLDPLHRQAKTVDPCYVPRAWIEPRYEGVNLRDRADRLSIERRIQEVQPDLVCLGPIYKMYRARAGETDEQAAGEVMSILDDLRNRYGFALILEHHAPKGSVSGRELLPHGTSLWLRWPEMGLKLVKTGPGVYQIGRWREDRVKAAWPGSVKRGGPWLWTGVYSASDEYRGVS